MTCKNKGWSVDARYELPMGFHLRADEDFNYLYRRDSLIGVFGKRGCLKIIADEAAQYERNRIGA